MKANLGPHQKINIDKLIESRLLIQANSGAGKSYAIRKLCEIAYGGPQIIIIDVEGEFHTLREKFDFVLAGPKDGDCVADVKSAGLLARKLLELNASAIVDIYELGGQRQRFVKLFLEALVGAPKSLWHPLLIVVDEAHMFCPEAGHSESANAVIDLMTLGRKRGFCGVLATQRIAKLHKDAAAECNNKLIGRSALDIDMKRAGAELGFTSKDDLSKLRTLPAGTFYGFGPALSDTVIEIKIGEVITLHPKAGARAIKLTTPRAVTQKILAQLADLPAAAAEEAKSVDELRVKVRQLEGELKKAKTSNPVEIKEVSMLTLADLKQLGAIFEKHQVGVAKLVESMLRRITADNLQRTQAKPHTQVFENKGFKLPELDRAEAAIVAARKVEPMPGLHDRAELKILGACAWMEAIGQTQAANEPIAFLAGYTVNGHFNNMRGRLRASGLIDYPSPGMIGLTDAGRELAPPSDIPPTLAGLHNTIEQKLDHSLWRLLAPLISIWPQELSASVLAEAAGYTVNGHFNNLRGRLRSLGLITYPTKNHIRAAALLFPEIK